MILDFLRLFSPNICPLCNSIMNKSDTIICFACKHSLPKTNYHNDPSDNQLHEIFWGKVDVKYALAFYHYTKKLKVQKLIHLLKYKNRADIGIEVGKLYGEILSKTAIKSEIDYIIPVPLHKKKLRKRGYNQSEAFAKGLSESLNIEVDINSLKRMQYTDTQTKKNRFNRWKNVEEKFKLFNCELFENKHVVIVDDVITTGSTIEACINEFKKQDLNITVSIISIAVASG